MEPTFPNVKLDLVPAYEEPMETNPRDVFDMVSEEEKQEVEPQTYDQEIVSFVMDRKEASEEFRKDKRQVWDQCWDHYLQVYDATGKENWQSRVFWPETPKVVETIVANLHGALLGPKMPIEWQVKVKEAEEIVRNTNDIIQNDINQSKFKLHMTDNLRELCILGTTVGRVDYELEETEVMVKTRQKAGLMGQAMYNDMGIPPQEGVDFTKKTFKTKDYASVKYVDLYKIYPEPYSTEITKDNWIIEERSISNAKLVELANHPDEFYRLINVDEQLLSTGNDVSKSEEHDTQFKRNSLLQPDTVVPKEKVDKEHTLYEFWGPAPHWMVYPETKGDPEYEYKLCYAWIWVIDGKFLVRAKPNPYRDAEPPYFKFPYIKIPGDWYGIGPAELMMFLQIEKNELVNTAVDNVNLMLNKVVAILKDKVPKDCWDRLKSAPMALWLFENTDDIRRVMMPIEYQNLLKDVYIAIDMVDRAIQEVTGAVRATIGTGGGGDEAGGGTFRGQMLNQQVATERWMLYAKTMEYGGMSDCWRKIYQRIYQYKTYENVRSILGEDRFQNFEFITPEELDAVADLVPLGVVTIETKGVKLAQMDQYAKTWMGQPWFKAYDLARRAWIEMGYTDPDSVIFSPEEMKRFNEARRAMLSQGAAVGEMSMEQSPEGATRETTVQPIAGNVPPPNQGMPQPALPARGPGASPIDLAGIPLG